MTIQLADFPTVTVVSRKSSTTVHAEPVGDGIAVIAFLGLEEDQPPRLGGGFTITHTPTGRAFVAGQACIECARVVATRLAGMGIDWTALADPTEMAIRAVVGEKSGDVIDALRLFGRCRQRVCWYCPNCGRPDYGTSSCDGGCRDVGFRRADRVDVHDD